MSQDEIEVAAEWALSQPNMVFGGNDRPQPCKQSRLAKNAMSVKAWLEQQQQ